VVPRTRLNVTLYVTFLSCSLFGRRYVAPVTVRVERHGRWNLPASELYVFRPTGSTGWRRDE